MSSGLDGLIIYQKVYDLILYALPIINRFPKSQRFVLGQQIENGLIDLSTMADIRPNIMRRSPQAWG